MKKCNPYTVVGHPTHIQSIYKARNGMSFDVVVSSILDDSCVKRELSTRSSVFQGLTLSTTICFYLFPMPGNNRATPEKTCDGQGRVASRAESENCVRCAGTGWLTGRDEGKRAMLRYGLARGPRRRKTCDAQDHFGITLASR
jgi:hypothetical protein